MVMIEDPYINKHNPQVGMMQARFGHHLELLFSEVFPGATIATVSPMTAKKVATGKGNATKDMMIDAMSPLVPRAVWEGMEDQDEWNTETKWAEGVEAICDGTAIGLCNGVKTAEPRR